MKAIQYLSLIFILSGTLSLQAQTPQDSVLNRNITIEREYQPAIQNAGKINALPNFVEPKVVRPTPQYTDFNLPMPMEQNIHYLSAAELVYQEKQNKEGYARISVGTGFNSLANFAFPLLKKPDMKLDFILDHYGLFNSKAHAVTQGAFLFDKKFNSFDLYAGLGGGHEYFKYYGSTFNSVGVRNFSEVNNAGGLVNYVPINNLQNWITPDSLSNLPASNNLWRLNANVGFRNSPVSEEVRFDARLNYNMFNVRHGITEHQIALHAKVDGEVGGNRLGVAFSSQNQLYGTSNGVLSPVLGNYYVLYINPYYRIERDAFDLHLGVKSSFSIAKGKGFAPSPDVRFEWRAVPKFLAIYVGAGGDYQVNSLNNIYQENYLLNPDVTVNDTYTPADFYAGVIIKPTQGLLIDAYVDYSFINDQYFFVNKAYQINHAPSGFNQADTMLLSNRFEAVYSNARLLKVGGRVSYTYERFSAQLLGAYNHWNVKDFEYAWHKPSWELDLNVNAHITKKLSVYGNVYLGGGRYAMMGNYEPVKLDPIMANINLGASYAIKDWFSVFLRINNLINNKYEQWAGYEVQGFNVMAGAAFSF